MSQIAPQRREHTAVDDEKSHLPESQDEDGERADSPGQAGKEVRELAAVAQAIDGDGATLNLGHDPGDDEGGEERKGLGDKSE